MLIFNESVKNPLKASINKDVLIKNQSTGTSQFLFLYIFIKTKPSTKHSIIRPS